MNITISILDFIHPPVFYLEHSISDPGFFHNLEVESIQLGPRNRASLCFQTPATTAIGFIRPTQHKAPVRVSIFHTLNL